MHHRRFAAFLLGIWFAGSILMLYLAVQNVTGVERVLGIPSAGAAKIVDKLGPDSARMFLRYHAAEQNREYFARWEIVQMLLGAFLAAVLYLGTHVNRIILILCGLMVLLVGFMHFALTPEITWAGRNLDFVPEALGGRTRLWVLHGLYLALEVLKLLLGAIITVYLFVFKTKVRSRPGAHQTDPLLSQPSRP